MSKFNTFLSENINNILNSALKAEFPVSINSEMDIFGDGVSFFVGQNSLTSKTPQNRVIVVQKPEATILIKKKEFSSFKNNNDLQWLDITETFLLRATKALFAYKVSQIRAYESLTKLQNDFKNTNEISLNLYIDLLKQSQFILFDSTTAQDASSSLLKNISNQLSQLNQSAKINDLLKIMQRNAFSKNNNLTTWIIDPLNTDNYQTGPGTGVIEITNFTDFSTSISLDKNSKSASISLEDPYRILNITDDDIEIAIKEALYGEVGLFEQIVNSTSSTYAPAFNARSVLSAAANLAGIGLFDNGIDINYIRDRLRTFYLGKIFINPGDAVHFYICGNKFSINHDNPDQSLDQFSIDDSILEAEYNLYTDKKLSFDEYKKIRLFGDESFKFRHVYAGVVKNTQESYSSGSYKATVNIGDNMEWLKWSTFMTQPAFQDPNGILEDPLTPYKLKTDESGRILTGAGPELLDENKYLLKSGLLSFDSGLLNGTVANENNLFQGQYGKGGSLRGSKILQHPSGLVYRWKQGIISATANFLTRDPISEDETTLRLNRQNYGLSAQEDILNNLDIANILSMLIVGQPYNVETFMRQALEATTLSTKTSASSLNPQDALSSVLDVVRRQNLRFGNFKPYRMITLSNNTLQQTVSQSTLRFELNYKIRDLQSRRSALFRTREQLSPQTVLYNKVTDQLNSIQKEIEAITKTAIEGATVNSGDILVSNFNLFGRNRVAPLSGNFDADHQLTRAMMLLGAQRKIEDVRLNRDQNFFIVSDQYDENTDIRPFLLAMRDSNYKIFQGNYEDVYSKCIESVNYTSLEFFANSQGHLEFRPPQWNKTPLSILNAMLKYEKITKNKIVPDYIKNIFETRIVSLKREVHLLNIKIVLLCLLIGRYPDSSIIPNLPTVGKNKSGEGNSKNSGINSLSLFGISVNEIQDKNKNNKTYLNKNINDVNIGKASKYDDKLNSAGIRLNVSSGDDGDILFGDTETLFGQFDPIFQETQIIGDSTNPISLGQSLFVSATSGGNSNEYATAEIVNKIREEFRKNFGDDPLADIKSQSEQISDSDFSFKSKDNSIELSNKYIGLLEDAISKRDIVVTILNRNKEKQKEIKEVEQILSGGEQISNGPFKDAIEQISKVNDTIQTFEEIITGDQTKGTLFDHLIEDDSRNFLGPGSGKRFVIKQEDIKSVSYFEEPPDYIKVDVIGDSPYIGKQLNSSYENRYYWAGATDFDLWRQYGYMSAHNEVLPFASDPERHCRPYALFLMQQQRMKINKASVTVAGNEYYEAGDVVYLQDKGLMYYVYSVDQSFSFGGDFSTTLSLVNGKPPGQYLPSPLDIIGQQLTKDPLFGNILVYRNIYGDDKYRALQPDSCLVFPKNDNISEENIAPLLQYKDNQLRLFNMMLDLSTITFGNRYVLLRAFVKNKNEEDSVKERLAIVKSLLQNPRQLSQGAGNASTNIDETLSGLTFGQLSSVGNLTVEQMSLPNNLQSFSIPSDKILEQIIYLDEKNSEISCLNPDIAAFQTYSGDENYYNSIFPKGGPKQRSWLDIRNDLQTEDIGNKVSSIIEIGILDITKDI